MTPEEKRNEINTFVKSLSEEQASEVIKLILSVLCDVPNKFSYDPLHRPQDHPEEKEGARIVSFDSPPAPRH